MFIKHPTLNVVNKGTKNTVCVVENYFLCKEKRCTMHAFMRAWVRMCAWFLLFLLNSTNNIVHCAFIMMMRNNVCDMLSLIVGLLCVVNSVPNATNRLPTCLD